MTHSLIPIQAIDLLDEAGSRARIAAGAARRASLERALSAQPDQDAGARAPAAAASWAELAQVLQAKDEAVKVRCRSWKTCDSNSL